MYLFLEVFFKHFINKFHVANSGFMIPQEIYTSATS